MPVNEKKADFPSMDELKKRLDFKLDQKEAAPALDLKLDLPLRKTEAPEKPSLSLDPLPQTEEPKAETEAPKAEPVLPKAEVPAPKPEKTPEKPAAQKSAGRRPDLFAPKITPPARKPDAPYRKGDNTPGCRVRLEPEEFPLETREFAIGVNESVTLGRNKRSDITLNETDTALSGLHFELQWDSRVLHLRDRKSTNGTALNGVPLRPEVWVRVTGNAVIQAGSDRYTVTVEKK